MSELELDQIKRLQGSGFIQTNNYWMQSEKSIEEMRKSLEELKRRYPSAIQMSKEEAITLLKKAANRMDIKTKQVEGGAFQAYLESDPNNLVEGATAKEAIQNYKNKASVTPVQAPTTPSAATEGNIIIKKLRTPVEINGNMALYGAYREGKEEVQGYGANQTAAKVDLLTKEQGK